MASNKQFLDDDIYNYDDSDTNDLNNNKLSERHKENPSQNNIIASKPILEVKPVDENPFSNKYKSNPKTKKKKQLKQDVAIKKLISISQKNIKVVSILKNIPKTYNSDSDYICQAIIEKYERENKIKESDIKTLVKDALEELVGDKYIIMKGSSDIQVASNNTTTSAPIIKQSSINQAISSKEEEEKESLLMGIIDDMDDD